MTYEELLAADLPTDPDRYRQLVAVIKRDGLPTEVDGEFRTTADAARRSESAGLLSRVAHRQLW